MTQPSADEVDAPGAYERLASCWLRNAHRTISRHSDYLNHINLFPVPDHDTGSNMAATLGIAVEALPADALPASSERGQLERATERMLLAALGNSGTILAAYAHGLVNALLVDPTSRAQASIAAQCAHGDDVFAAAALAAQRSVVEPVAGTMLDVFHAFGDRERGAPLLADVSGRYRRAFGACEGTATDTGTVDAGALGALMCLSELVDIIAGGQAGAAAPSHEALIRPESNQHQSSRGDLADSDMQEVQAVLAIPPGGEHRVRSLVTRHGESVILAGPAAACRLHVHTAGAEALRDALRHAGCDITNWATTPLVGPADD